MSHPKVTFSFRNRKDEPASLNNEDSEMDDDQYSDEFSSWRSELSASAFIESSVSGEKPQEIGHGVAYIVNRPSIRGDWWGLMDGPDDEFQEFSTVLFNSRGYFRKELYEHPTKKGTGVFGPELGLGKLLNIQYIRVEAEYRRRGIGRKLVEGLQGLAEEKGILLSFCWPTPIGRDRDNEDDSVPVPFMRSAGYRRVGLTNVLCRSSDVSHPSRSLAIALDVEVPGNPWKDLSEEEIQNKFPIHFMIMNLPPQLLISKLQSLPADTNWRAKDFSLQSPLHMAAFKKMSEVIEFLLSKNGVRNDLTVIDEDGYTPLAKVIEHERLCRENMDSMTSRPELWNGFSDQSMQTMKLLTEAMGGVWNEDVEKRARFGCTCGSCIEGYISPSMGFEILRWCHSLICGGAATNRKPGQAEDQRDVLRGSTAGDEDEDDVLAHFPRSIPKINREHPAFKNGVSSILDGISRSLRGGKLPSVEMVQDKAQADASAAGTLPPFVEMGGTVEDAFRALFKFIRKHNIKQGDGTFYTDFEDQINALPVCENDDRVSFVRAMLLHEASRAGMLTETEKQENYYAFLVMLENSRVSSGHDVDF